MLTGATSVFPGSRDYLYNDAFGAFQGKSNGIAPVNQITASDWNHVGDCVYNIEKYALQFSSSQDVQLIGFKHFTRSDVAMVYVVSVTGTIPSFVGRQSDDFYTIQLHDSDLAPHMSADAEYIGGVYSSTNATVSSLSFTNIPDLGKFGKSNYNYNYAFLMHGMGWCSGTDASGRVTPLSITCEALATSLDKTTPAIRFNVGFRATPTMRLNTSTNPNLPWPYYYYDIDPQYENTIVGGRHFTIRLFAFIDPTNNYI